MGADGADLQPLGGFAPEVGVAGEFALDGVGHGFDEGGAEESVLGQGGEQGDADDGGEAQRFLDAGGVHAGVRSRAGGGGC